MHHATMKPIPLAPSQTSIAQRFTLRTSLMLLAFTAAASQSLTIQAASLDDEPKVTISGFGSIFATKTDNTTSQFRVNGSQTKGYESLDIGGDSRLGVQGRFDFNKDVSAVVQVISQRYGAEDFVPRMDWAYAQYSGIPKTDFRVGRVLLPAFMISDSRLVSYTLPGVRVPAVIYSLIPASSLDGIQVTHRQRLGPVNVTLNASAGNSQLNDTTYRKVRNANITGEMGDWLLRYGYNSAFDSGITRGVFISRDDYFHNLGIRFDNGKLTVSAEYTRRLTEPNYYNNSGYYISSSYKFGDWTPALTYTDQKVDPSIAKYPFVVNGRTVPSTLISPPGIKSITASLRYDIATNTSFKVEISQYDGTTGLIYTPPARTPLKMNTFSFGMDFVF